jgi:hypothetical protein
LANDIFRHLVGREVLEGAEALEVDSALDGFRLQNPTGSQLFFYPENLSTDHLWVHWGLGDGGANLIFFI